MKNLNIFLASVTLVFQLFLGSCTGNKSENKPATPVAVAEPVSVGKETTLLLNDLVNNGDYVNSQEFPSLIKASLVYENLEKNMLVVDLRTSAAFRNGHIKGSVNKQFEELPAYFESGIKPFEYDRIILVCEDGQLSSYTTCLLRLMGYGNVFAMRWGMSSWNKKYAGEGWLKSVSGKYENNLEVTVNPMPPARSMPELNTGKTTGEEIGSVRFAGLFREGSDNFLISADEVFTNPDKYYIINYERKDKYENGHIPGSIRYKTDGLLGMVSEMATVSQDKPVVIYCGTGHNSGFVTAYLRLFGYDAKTLAFGNNGFMYNKMLSQKAALSWMPFTQEEVHDYPVAR